MQTLEFKAIDAYPAVVDLPLSKDSFRQSQLRGLLVQV